MSPPRRVIGKWVLSGQERSGELQFVERATPRSSLVNVKVRGEMGQDSVACCLHPRRAGRAVTGVQHR